MRNHKYITLSICLVCRVQTVNQQRQFPARDLPQCPCCQQLMFSARRIRVHWSHGGIWSEHRDSLHSMCYQASTISTRCHSYSKYMREFDHDTLLIIKGKNRARKEIDFIQPVAIGRAPRSEDQNVLAEWICLRFHREG